MNKQIQLLLVLAVPVLALLLLPKPALILLGSAVFAGIPIFFIVQLFRNAENGIKMLAYLVGIVFSSIVFIKMIVALAETVPIVNTIMTMSLIVMALVFWVFCGVRLSLWAFRKLWHTKHRDILTI